MSEQKPHVVLSTEAIYVALQFLDNVRLMHAAGDDDHLLDETAEALRSLAGGVDFIISDPKVVLFVDAGPLP